MSTESSGDLSLQSWPDSITKSQRACWDVPGTTRFTSIFLQHWAPLVGIRADGFLWAFDVLERYQKGYYRIVETGCMRRTYRPLDFAKDGCSTLLFDRFVQKMGGSVVSVDVDPEAIAYAREFVNPDSTTLYCHDSVHQLCQFVRYRTERIDLLYLDSMDYVRTEPVRSERHHLYELTAAMKRLHAGSIVMVDDNYPDGSGKGRLITDFFRQCGMEPAFNGIRQLAWVMP